MPSKQPSLVVQRDLYQAMSRIKDLAPWDWMAETDIFGVQHPDTGQMGFVSVMGMAGEHYAVAVYLGSEGLYGFWDLQESGPIFDPQQVMEIPELQASFEDRDYLQQEDRDVIKQLGLKYRGSNAWPMFRSYHPGFFPWFLEAGEAVLLLAALEQLLDVAPRFKDKRRLLSPPGDDTMLVRVGRRKDEAIVWEDSIMRIPPPEGSTINLVMDSQQLERLEVLPSRDLILEVDLSMQPTPLREKKGDRPYFPYMLMTADARSGAILGMELLQPIPSLENMWGRVPAAVVKQLGSSGFVPNEIRVASPLLYGLLQPLAKDTGFKLVLVDDLPAINEARDSFQQFLGIDPFG